MIKKWDNFINEEVGNPKLLSFYNDYKNLFDGDTSGTDLYDEVGELTNKHDVSYVEVGEVLNTMDTSFDVDGLLKATYDNWMEDGMTKGSGFEEEPDSIKQKIYDALYDMSRKTMFTKGGEEDDLEIWLDELSDDNLEMLFNILAGSGKIESSY